MAQSLASRIAGRACAAVAACILATVPCVARASTGSDTVIWTTANAPAAGSCLDKPSYTRPGRYSLRYACGRWYLHRPHDSLYAELMLAGLLIVGFGLKLARGKPQ